MLETLVGGYIGNAQRRPELGETVVAVSLAGSESWQLLSPGSRVVPYTDAGWAASDGERSAHLDRVNAALMVTELVRMRGSFVWLGGGTGQIDRVW